MHYGTRTQKIPFQFPLRDCHCFTTAKPSAASCVSAALSRAAASLKAAGSGFPNATLMCPGHPHPDPGITLTLWMCTIHVTTALSSWHPATNQIEVELQGKMIKDASYLIFACPPSGNRLPFLTFRMQKSQHNGPQRMDFHSEVSAKEKGLVCPATASDMNWSLLEIGNLYLKCMTHQTAVWPTSRLHLPRRCHHSACPMVQEHPGASSYSINRRSLTCEQPHAIGSGQQSKATCNTS